MNSFNTQSGFTLIELVTVVVLLGIVAVVVSSRFMSADSFSPYSTRDQIVAAARFAQQRAMYDHSGNCYYMQIVGSGIFIRDDTGTIGPDQSWLDGIAIDASVSVADVSIYFDGLGNALDPEVANCAGSPTTTTISVVGDDNLGVCIYDSGYIQAC